MRSALGRVLWSSKKLLGYLLLLPPPGSTAPLGTARDLTAAEPACPWPLRAGLEKGPGSCWVVTVTNKNSACAARPPALVLKGSRTLLGGELAGRGVGNEVQSSPCCLQRGEQSSARCEVQPKERNAKQSPHSVPSRSGRGPHQATCSQKVRQSGNQPQGRSAAT